jgi:hypothetical protein
MNSSRGRGRRPLPAKLRLQRLEGRLARASRQVDHWLRERVRARDALSAAKRSTRKRKALSATRRRP